MKGSKHEYPNTAGIKRRPTHPGEILREDFLPDYNLTVDSLVQAVGVSRQSINDLLRERRALNTEMARIKTLKAA